jgi:dienelactone hydrolase
VIFSHGSSGTPTHASYLTEHLASWGYVVVAPSHPGNTLQDGACDIGCLGDSHNNRVDDVLFALDQVLALMDDPSQPIGTIVDPERTAVTGFSFGGMTAVRAAPERRFDAIVGIAPAAPESLIEVSQSLDVPVLIASGGQDIAVPSDQVQALFDTLPDTIERYQLYLPKAKHTSFQNDCQEDCQLPQARAHELINRYVTAFLETYIKGNERYARFLENGEPPDLELTRGGT